MITYDEIRGRALAKPGTKEDRPFDGITPVFKVLGRMFLLAVPQDEPLRITVKCEPERAQFLREFFGAVRPGYHMNKRHWNTVIIDGSIPAEEIVRFIDDSYDLVVAALPKARRRELEAMAPPFEEAPRQRAGGRA